VGSFQPLGGILPTVLRSVLARQPMSSGKLAFAWRASVGTAIARATRLERRSDDVLLVHPTSPQWRHELETQRELIEARLRTWLGNDFAGLVILSGDEPLDTGR
jgi:predicted nucleic acid-binding Zn ribbon protein